MIMRLTRKGLPAGGPRSTAVGDRLQRAMSFARMQPLRFARLTFDHALLSILTPSIGRIGAMWFSRHWADRHVRLIEMPSGRIGHYVMDSCFTQLQLCEEDRLAGITSTTFWFDQSESSNPVVGRIWRRNERFLPRHVAKPVHSALRRQGRVDIARAVVSATVPRSLFLSRQPPREWLTDREVSHCRRVLDKAGIDTARPWVCVHNRETGYEEFLHNESLPSGNYRNGSVMELGPAALALVERGFTVYRMGTHMRQRFDLDNPAVVDYAHAPYASRLLDVYLSGACRFFISSGSGIDSLAGWMWRPIVYLNLVMPVVVGHGFWTRSLISFQKPADAATGLPLSAEEFAPMRQLFQASPSGTRGVSLVRHGPDLVCAIAKEMATLLADEPAEGRKITFWREPGQVVVQKGALSESEAFDRLCDIERSIAPQHGEATWQDAVSTSRRLVRISQAWLDDSASWLFGAGR